MARSNHISLYGSPKVGLSERPTEVQPSVIIEPVIVPVQPDTAQEITADNLGYLESLRAVVDAIRILRG